MNLLIMAFVVLLSVMDLMLLYPSIRWGDWSDNFSGLAYLLLVASATIIGILGKKLLVRMAGIFILVLIAVSTV